MAAKKQESKKTPAEESEFGWEQYAEAGLENVSQSDLGIPFLIILQKGNPELDPDSDKYVEGLKMGDIIMTTTKKKYGDRTKPVTVIPISFQKAYVEWTPREAGGGYINSHGHGIMSKTTKNEKGQDVLENGNIIVTTAYFTVFVYDEDEGEWLQAVIAMSSTQLKKSRQWLTITASHKGTDKSGNKFILPMFSHQYTLTATPESNNKGTWLGWCIEQHEMVKDRSLVDRSASVCREIAAGSMQQLAPPAGEEPNIPF